jgi:uncharacterized protein YhaN
MRLTKAEVDGFGQLYRKEMTLDAPVIVIYGPNEAGKSTMFGFIRTMLYGFARRTQPVLRQEPVHGGKHGGRLFIRSADGGEYVLERYAASGATNLSLRRVDAARAADRYSESVTLAQPEWEREFLGGVNERLYRQLYAITLSELQEVGALSGEELGRYLYQAGWDGGRSIAAAEKKLIQELEQLFKPRGTNPDIQQQLKTLEQVEAELRKRTDAIAAYNDRSRQDEQLGAAIAALEAERPAAQAKALLLGKACSSRPLWLRRQQLASEHARLAYSLRITTPDAKRWAELAQQRESSRAESEQLRQQLLLLELQQQGLEYDEELIRAGEKAGEVLQGAERIRLLKDESVILATELREHDDAIARLAGSIAPEWTERQLREFHATVADRDEMRSVQARFAEQERIRERQEAEREHVSREEREATAALREVDAAIAAEEARRGADRVQRSERAALATDEERHGVAGAQGESSMTLALEERRSVSGTRRSERAVLATDEERRGAAGADGEAAMAHAAERGSALGTRRTDRAAFATDAERRGVAGAQSETAMTLTTADRREWEKAAPLELLPLGREALRAAWGAVDRALREWELERARASGSAREAEPEQAGRSGAGLLWGLAAAAGGAALALAIAALGGSVGSGWAAAAAAVLAAALAIAALLRARGAAHAAPRAQPRGARSRAGRSARGQAAAAAQPGGEAEARVRRALAGLLREPAEAAAALLAAQPHGAAEQALAQLQAAVDARLDSLAQSERLAAQRAEQLRSCERLRQRAAELGEAMAAAERNRQAAARQWAGWLAARALPETMSPAAALEAFELAEQALRRLLQYDRQAAKLAAAEQEIAAFAQQAAALCGPLEEARRQLAADPALALRLLQAEGNRHAAAKQEALGIAARRAALSLRMEEAGASIQAQLAEQAELLHAADIADESGYTTALEHKEQAERLEQELSRLTLELNAGLSDGRKAELESLFASYDEEQLEAMLREAKAQYEQLEQSSREMLEQRGRVKQAIEHLLQEDEQRKLLARKAMTLAQLEQDSERYAVLAISAALIRRTKRIYEEEKQPVVLRKASAYIAELTSGKYIRILSTPGEAGLRLETANHQLIDSSLLSRGTAELVYLAMRLALAAEASASHKLPLMLDDVFVNFDRERLHAIIRLLTKLAAERQVIVMTCHEHIRDAMQEHNKLAALVEL